MRRHARRLANDRASLSVRQHWYAQPGRNQKATSARPFILRLACKPELIIDRQKIFRKIRIDGTRLRHGPEYPGRRWFSVQRRRRNRILEDIAFCKRFAISGVIISRVPMQAES